MTLLNTHTERQAVCGLVIYKRKSMSNEWSLMHMQASCLYRPTVHTEFIIRTYNEDDVSMSRYVLCRVLIIFCARIKHQEQFVVIKQTKYDHMSSYYNSNIAVSEHRDNTLTCRR